MPTPPMPRTVMQEAVNALAKAGGVKTEAAKLLGIPCGTFDSRMRRAVENGIQPSGGIDDPNNIDHVRHRLKTAEAALRKMQEVSFDERVVREQIIKLSNGVETTSPPDWALRPEQASRHSPGVPTLLASDWHWGERVDASQIGGVNRYNLDIAGKRARRLIETTIDLLNNHMVNPKYPGIVFALGGDMVSGDIHEELIATNDAEIMPVLLDLFGVLCWCIETLRNAFGNVFCPCVGGNHSRTTHRIRAKGRNFTSFDWLLYSFLAKRFEGDKRVSFLIPNGLDALYRIYGHRYLLTHGDQLGKGGDGLIGMLGPVLRGDHKKRGRNSQIDMGYDTMVIGHYHQLTQMQRVIVNGSLIGYNEYAYVNNFGFEVPRQALWITHPVHGITISMPVNVDEPRKLTKREWVSVKD